MSLPAPYYQDAAVTLYCGDCRAILPTIEADFDACVTDPPYELGFMAREWDRRGIAFDPATWAAVLRVLKPGGVLMAFGGTRTWHRMAVAIEDAGFQIFDTLMWLHGQGFPKHKTLLKPAWEPIILAKRPGAGGLNVEAGRLGDTVETWPASRGYSRHDTGSPIKATQALGEQPPGRWPANVALTHHPECVETGVQRVKANRWGKDPVITCEASIGYGGSDVPFKTMAHHDADGTETIPAFACHPECPVALLDAMSGERDVSGSAKNGRAATGVYPVGIFGVGDRQGPLYNDTGGASRFYYCAKAPARERLSADDGTRHPTQKPQALMRWLVALACPPGGRLLDPFMGSGTTLVEARRIASHVVGIDAEAAYIEIAAKRLAQSVLPLELVG